MAKRRPVVTRPAKWWREPVDPAKLQGLLEDEQALLIAQARLLATEKVKDDIRLLRNFSRDFTAAKGYPLKTTDLIRIHSSKLKKLYHAAQAIRRAQAKPHVIIAPKNSRQQKTARQRAGSLVPNQKKYIFHPGTTDASAEFVNHGRTIQIMTPTADGSKIFERLYYFARNPRTWDDVVEETAALVRSGIPPGMYKLYTSIYGAIGGLVQREKMLESLDTYLASYNRWLAGNVLGWQWFGTSLASARKRQQKQKGLEERFSELRKRRRREESDRIKTRLGIKHPKRRK